jgi:hypothetical protein
MCHKRSFAAREMSAPVTLSRRQSSCQELGVARGPQEGRTILAIGAYWDVKVAPTVVKVPANWLRALSSHLRLARSA